MLLLFPLLFGVLQTFSNSIEKRESFFGVSLVNTKAEKKRKDKHSFIIGIIKMYGNLISCPGIS